jgi:hypothetical protein
MIEPFGVGAPPTATVTVRPCAVVMLDADSAIVTAGVIFGRLTTTEYDPDAPL